MPTAVTDSPRRRAVLKGTAWAAPSLIIATAAPAIAASLLEYRDRASLSWRYDVGAGYFYLSNHVTRFGTSPYGYQIVASPFIDGSVSEDSPTTNFTVSGLRITVDIPAAALDRRYLRDPFYSVQGNWKLDPARSGRSQNLTSPGGYTQAYIHYEFIYTGPTTGTTVPDGKPPAPWTATYFDTQVRMSYADPAYVQYLRVSYLVDSVTLANGGNVQTNRYMNFWTKRS